jgi:hypothetical protein
MNLKILKQKRKELEEKKSNWKFRHNKKRNWYDDGDSGLSRYGMTREDDSLWAMAFDWGSQ